MLTVVIPTYWTRPIGAPSNREDLVFDHPTPLDGIDTLTKTLESIKRVTADIQVVVVTATVHHELDETVEKKVADLIEPFKEQYPILQFAANDLEFIRTRLKLYGLNQRDISLDGYSSIRNCQLLVPLLLNSEVVAAIDDDELVDPDFADKAVEFIGKEVNGRPIDGIAGRYFYEWGSYRVQEPQNARAAVNLFDRKHVLQNDSYDLFDKREGRVVDTSITLGGNMVFSRELLKNVPFDPAITRGEDIDYLINSMMYGYRWQLDKELIIYHYPPPCNPTNKLREDVIRFFYEKRKIELSSLRDDVQTLSEKTFKPYPGEFFSPRLEADAAEALRKNQSTLKTPTFHKLRRR
ncbi:MAG: hypothetical protein U5P10_07460 [Spirochaetia bacterium]|nr:hypothetical protein [Spirochaetia bacterium]